MLSPQDIDQFITEGYVKINNAFSSSIAENCREVIWKHLPVSPDKPNKWSEPVIRLGELTEEPLIQSANTSSLRIAYDQLAHDNWEARESMGTFPVRFPSVQKPVDIGWHIDASFDYHLPDFMDWKVNIFSKGRALLMLFLYSDVTSAEAPTLIKKGSHIYIASILRSYGAGGRSLRQLSDAIETAPDFQVTEATGTAGTVYLCHPFLIHSAQEVTGTSPKLMAQPPLMSKRDFDVYQGTSPIAKAIQKGLNI